MIALTIVSAIVMAGCPAAKKEQGTAQMDEIAAQIQATLAERPDVVEARVVYKNNVSAVGSVAIDMKARAGTNFTPVLDEAVKLTWLSRLEPLHTIAVDVVDAADLQRNETRLLDANGKDQVDLERTYGQRPK